MLVSYKLVLLITLHDFISRAAASGIMNLTTATSAFVLGSTLKFAKYFKSTRLVKERVPEAKQKPVSSVFIASPNVYIKPRKQNDLKHIAIFLAFCQ